MTQHRSVFACSLLWVSVCAFAAQPAAEEAAPPPEKPWRPFADMPEVLFFEGFEGATHHAGKGGITEDRVCLPGKKAYKLGANNKTVIVSCGMGKAKFPNGLQPSQIHIQFMLYAEDTGTVTLKFNAGKGGDYADKITISKAKQWIPIITKLGDARTKNMRAMPDHIVNDLEITVAGRNNADAPASYIDNLCITHAVKPDMLLPRIMAKMGKMADIARTVSKDGFAFSEEGGDKIKTALKSARRRKAKEVLVFADIAPNTPEVIKALQAAATKLKLAGFSFAPPVAPDKTPVGGLDDLRTLLPYNIETVNPEYVLILFNYNDAVKAGRIYDPARICIERALEAGSVPIVCLAPGGAKADSFNAGIQRICGELGICYIDSAVVLKGAVGKEAPKEPAKDPKPKDAKDAKDAKDVKDVKDVKKEEGKAPAAAEATELNASALELLAPVIVNALKHVETNLKAK